VKAEIIDIDECKTRVPGYTPDKAYLFHRESARLADIEFKRAIKNSEHSKVILMCGGSASGKTEFISSELNNMRAIIYDGTLSNPQGAKVKIRNCQSKHKNVEIYAIIPDELNKSLSAFLARERKVPIETFVKTHSGSRKTLNWISKRHQNIKINIYESSFKKNKLAINKYIFSSVVKRDKFINDIQLSEDKIKLQIQTLI